jgi:hypothetical protein
MKLLAVAKTPAQLERAAEVLARVLGLTLAECRMRLAPEPPALLARLESTQADAAVRDLRHAGIAAVTVEVPVPTERDRIVAHSVSFSATHFTVTVRHGDPLEVAWPDVAVVLRGVRETRRISEHDTTVDLPSVEATVMTGGAWRTIRSVETVRSSSVSSEQVILVYAMNGQVVSLAEHELDFTCLGPALQPSSTANMAELAARVRHGAPRAFYDERLMRLTRRPLPLVAGAGWSSRAGSWVVTSTETGSSLDVLAEVMRQAVAESVLP